MVNSNPKPRLRLENDTRREDLLKLGKKLFGECSYDALLISDIAERAGISKGLLYHYFPTKKDFYVATVRAGAEELIEKLEKNLQNVSPILKLSGSVDQYLTYAEENSKAYLSLFKSGVGVDPEVSRIIESVRERIMQLFWDALGLDHPTDYQKIALRGWIGFAEGACQDWLVGRNISREELGKLILRQLVFAFSGSGILKGVARSVLTKLKALAGIAVSV